MEKSAKITSKITLKSHRNYRYNYIEIDMKKDME